MFYVFLLFSIALDEVQKEEFSVLYRSKHSSSSKDPDACIPSTITRYSQIVVLKCLGMSKNKIEGVKVEQDKTKN